MVLLAGVGLLVGATFGGADWANRLDRHPAPLRVASCAAVAHQGDGGHPGHHRVAALVRRPLLGGAQPPSPLARELGVDTEVWEPVLAMTGRGLALVAGATLGAFALTMVLHSTVATLDVLFGYTVLVEALAASPAGGPG